MTDRAAWEVRHGDCLDWLTGEPDESVSAFVTDPPYCSGSISEAGRTRATHQGLRSETIKAGRFKWFDGDNMGTAGLSWLLRAVAFEAVRLLEDGGSFVCFCDWRMTSALEPAIESAGLRKSGLIVWNKGSMGLGVGFRPQMELAMHFTKGVGRFYDKSIGNVITVPRPTGDEREHETQKPIDLMRSIVRVVASPGGLVVDPFTGSGSTGVAALLEGRRFLGFERAAGHVETARSRIAAAHASVDRTAPASLDRASQQGFTFGEVGHG